MKKTEFIRYLVVFIVFAYWVPLQCLSQSGEGVVVSSDPNKEVDKNAMLEVDAEDKGVLLPRMSWASLLAITPLLDADGLTVYVTDDDKQGIYTFTEGDWHKLSAVQSDGAFNDAPLGAIVMYHGSLEYFDETGKGFGPCEGWVICNGKYGAPDMRGLFVAGVGNDNYPPNYPSSQDDWQLEEKNRNDYSAVGVFKGSHVAEISSENLAKHTHAVTTSDGSPTSTIEFDVTHKHNISIKYPGSDLSPTMSKAGHYIKNKSAGFKKTGEIARRRMRGKEEDDKGDKTSRVSPSVPLNLSINIHYGKLADYVPPTLQITNGTEFVNEDPVPDAPEPYWYDNRPETYCIVYILRTNCTDCSGNDTENCVRYDLESQY